MEFIIDTVNLEEIKDAIDHMPNRWNIFIS